MNPKCQCSSKKGAEGDLIHAEGSVTMGGGDCNDAATSQGVLAATRTRGKQHVKGAQACRHLDFGPVKQILEFLPPELWESKFLLV